MKKVVLLSFGFLIGQLTIAQDTAHVPKVSKDYRASAEKINDLVHTKLDVKFDYLKSYLYGKAWISLKPHFYPTDSLRLDAKGMNIQQVAIVKGKKITNLNYTYGSLQLNIHLDKLYKGGEQYTVYIDYTSKPDEFKPRSSANNLNAKGLYFINPKGEIKDKPTQIWTQGETESNSMWFPTIDKPNQKCTEEIYMTVPSKYVTLSNGILISRKNNADGTRTDYWKMDLPHSPYLFFMGVGEYAVIKDSYKGKEVAYYVEKKYAPVARRIFGQTPEMMALFSRLTGVDYPWPKYDQIVGRDFVSGAMENTTATLHKETAQQDARQLVDYNAWESVIAHELFHQWFGDYVTTESWSNITLNESFATIGSQLWNEYKYGKDNSDEERYNNLQGYLRSNSENKDLVRFYYKDKEDVFDAVSYSKGGAILQMLRKYVGDSAFFKSLNLYLNNNKFKNAEAQNLRLAFEEVTGQDLNWFWTQWYYGSGHPKLDVTYNYDRTNKNEQVIVKQTQTTGQIFRMPVAIDVYTGPAKKRYNVWVKNPSDTFNFMCEMKPDLINFDGDKILLAEKRENKTLDEYIHQYKFAGNYIDRTEAVDSASKRQDEAKALEILKMGLQDRYDAIRSQTINGLNIKNDKVKLMAEPILVNIAQKDEKRLVRSVAIFQLGEYKQNKYLSLFKAALSDSSYYVAGRALEAIYKIDSIFAFDEAKHLIQSNVETRLSLAVCRVIMKIDTGSEANRVFTNFEKLEPNLKFAMLPTILDYLNKVNSRGAFRRGVDDIVTFVKNGYRPQLTFVEPSLKNLQKSKLDKGEKDLSDYVESKLPELKQE